jgi:hypothetical protein
VDISKICGLVKGLQVGNQSVDYRAEGDPGSESRG